MRHFTTEEVAVSDDRLESHEHSRHAHHGETKSNGRRVRLHRLKDVRREQGLSLRRVAIHLHVDQDEVRRQEEPGCDLLLSQLYQWQKVLEVPVADLLVESNAPLSPPVMERARMVRLMKTAAALYERADTSSLRRLCETLISQIKEIMPELEGITPWTDQNSVRRRRERSLHMPRQFMMPEGWGDA
ncbi:MAG: hypothetical protein JSS27_20085 [Planctomycetes bacterium]|nr:hypothetical protein [Planctomycetota bacterium]